MGAQRRAGRGGARRRASAAAGLTRFDDALAAHPRHALLTALVAGLLAGPRSPLVMAGALALVLVAVRSTPLAFGALAALLAGAALADARLAALDHSALAMGELTARATLLEHPRLRPSGARVAAAGVQGERVVLTAHARVRWPGAGAPGSVLLVDGRLAPLGERDAHERRRGAHARLFADAIRDTGARRGGLLGALDRVRARSERALTRGVPAPQGALARGMVLGQDGALTDAVREDFRATGLAHLVAASGANVVLLATLVLALGTALGLGLSARLWLALVLVAAYVPLAGGGPSIQRAAVMGAAGLLAALAGRPASRWYALLLAAALTLIWNPRAVGDAGWQLSFAAVLAMLALVPTLRARLTAAGLPRGLAEASAVTAAATLGTAPLIALHFERLSLVSLPANVLAAAVVAPVMWLGTIAAALGQIAPALAVPPAALAALPLGFLTWLADRAAVLPFAELEVSSPGPIGVLAIYVAAGAVVVLWRRLPRRNRRVAGVVLAAGTLAGVVALAVQAIPPGPPQELTISFLDVGQGDATLVQHGDAAILIDTGPPGDDLVAQLRAAGVRRLDVLAISHDALDHDGATAAVLDALPVGLVLDGEEELADPQQTQQDARAGAAPDGGQAFAAGGQAFAAGGQGLAAGGRPSPSIRALARARGVRRIASDAGQVLRAGPIELRVLWPRRDPPAPPGAEPNDRATVLHVRDGAFDLLLSADAESDVLAGLSLPSVDALKVAHHGSDDPGLPQLLARTRPRAAVISVGARNRYGHPTPATLAALSAVPLVRRTDRDGTVRLTARQGRIDVATTAKPG